MSISIITTEDENQSKDDDKDVDLSFWEIRRLWKALLYFSGNQAFKYFVQTAEEETNSMQLWIKRCQERWAAI